VLRWFLDADDNPHSHQNLIISFWPICNVSLKYACKFIPWYLHLVDKLTNKKCAKTINLLCAGNKVFLNIKLKGGGLTPTPLCVRPWPHKRKTKVFLPTWCALSILVYFSKCQNVNSGCPPSQLHAFSAQLVFEETFEHPYIFAVVNCADAALSAFYIPVATRCRIVLQLWTALSYSVECCVLLRCPNLERWYNLCSLRWHIVQQRVSTVRVEQACTTLKLEGPNCST